MHRALIRPVWSGSEEKDGEDKLERSRSGDISEKDVREEEESAFMLGSH